MRQRRGHPHPGLRHRWAGDDSLIYTHTLRQILAGNEPVFNARERAESSTGTLSQWLVALGALITGVDVLLVAVALASSPLPSDTCWPGTRRSDCTAQGRYLLPSACS